MMISHALWKTLSKSSASYPQLVEDIEVDVCIIGGGITGITAANQLLLAGKKVALLEAHKIGGVTTACSTGNLYIPVQPFYQTIAQKFDEKTVLEVAQYRRFAIDYIEKNVQEKGIQCNFTRRPWYAFTAGEKASFLEKEFAFFDKMGINAQYTQELPLEFKFKKALLIPNQARFNPLQYVISMAEDLANRGCLIFEDSRVDHYCEDKLCTVSTQKGKITAEHVIMATHTPIGINLKQMFTAPYRSYVVSAFLKQQAVVTDVHLWDLDTKHTYSTHAVKGSSPDILMMTGDHHKTGQGHDMQAHFTKLKTCFREIFPAAEFAYEWSAQHYRSADDIPYIGLASSMSHHTYAATGYFADGLVYGTVAGIFIADRIAAGKSAPEGLFAANRHKLFTSLPFVSKENINVLGQYVQDLPLSEHNDLAALQEGEGKIVQINREKWAVCRNQNQVHIVSAVCPHMKCIVKWNEAEKTWDCPCHGSRFSHEGEFIEGPALANLKKYEK
ncbi:FAD-dependent oxidoreductase [Legionella sp. 27cVA30]|uniref:FAD-dependent oxidoreductase n=1 Tax=Legionella TaxID=445 RepID=UPI000F8D82CD|nr:MULTISPECIES: FAD-dependent oxidoreductase [Legionella]MCP0913235.1 FAD-dependent oxidoreductase [Legionella sp. 27cVA30]RUR17046.1 FAD-dependent oxidoreductase [Legionella septentrionalis]